jgi:hypothetical protein
MQSEEREKKNSALHQQVEIKREYLLNYCNQEATQVKVQTTEQ